MKKLAAICLLLASLHARADVTIVEQVQTDAQGPGNQEITMKIKGTKVRMDMMAGQMSGIFDTATGDAIGLIHNMKTFVQISGDQLKTLISQAQKRHANPDADPAATDEPKIVDTGKQEKVGDYNAEIYTLETDRGKTTLWVSKEVPDAAAIQDVMKSVMALVGKLGINNKMPDISKIDGVAVKTETVVNGKTFTVTMVSVKQDPIADAEFQVPTGYTEMQQPNMGMGAIPPPPPQQPAGGDSSGPPQP